MLLTLVLAIAIPDAFGGRALLFAGSYVMIQLSRHLFLTFVAASKGTIERERAGRILFWFVVAGVFWIAGRSRRTRRGPRSGSLALGIDLTAPLHLYSIPGRPPLSHHDVGGRDGALRRALPALHDHRPRRDDRPHRRDDSRPRPRRRPPRRPLRSPSSRPRRSGGSTSTTSHGSRSGASRSLPNRTQLARDGYTYLHAVLVAGIILAAVGDELVIAHPSEELPRGGASRRRRRAGAVPPRARALPAADGRVDRLETARGSGCVPLRRAWSGSRSPRSP